MPLDAPVTTANCPLEFSIQTYPLGTHSSRVW
jgi:hypothetical protein